VADRGPLATACLVLAGGRSTRFGRDKLLEHWQGEPLFWAPLRAAAAACDELVLCWRADGPAPDLPELPEQARPVRVVRDLRPGEGPLAGLAAGLAAVEAGAALCVAGDMPLLQAALLRGLAARSRDWRGSARALVVGGVVRPLPCLVRVDLAAPAATHRLEEGRLSLLGLLDALGAELVPEPAWRAWDPGGRSLEDVDTAADLERLRR
jgi:molybdopterin-guanine dinucleotide biosynthesis protein A